MSGIYFEQAAQFEFIGNIPTLNGHTPLNLDLNLAKIRFYEIMRLKKTVLPNSSEM